MGLQQGLSHPQCIACEDIISTFGNRLIKHFIGQGLVNWGTLHVHAF
jgi:hypothetical protein